MATIGKNIHHAVQVLSEGQVIGMPTETVYGLAGNALNEEAIVRIFEVKNRPRFDPLIAHIGHRDQLTDLAKDIPSQAVQLIDAFWPGPLTLLLEKTTVVPHLLTSGSSRVAIRLPAHEVARALLSKVHFPLAAPSANPFGYVSPTTARHVHDQLGDRIPYILDGGPSAIGLESTIVGFEMGRPVVYRLGGLTLEAIEDVIGEVTLQRNKSSNPAAPGMLKSHYSPGKPVIIGDVPELLEQYDAQKTGVISLSEQYDVLEMQALSPSGSVTEAAQHLFRVLRLLDDSDVEVILAERFPDEGLGRAINDRLERAGAR
ncbi:MAG: L-threonylcarbamoyladenylate synthase [Bacteroidota bacterium]